MARHIPLLPVDAWKRYCLLAFVLACAVSCIAVPYPKYFWLQHVPTVAALLGLVWAERRFTISRGSYLCILAFLSLHLLGARYLYTYVPYDEWTEQLLGFRISRPLGLTRNHYDRFVHFAFGVLLLPPLERFCDRFVGIGGKWRAMVAVSLVLSASAIYEIFEWLVAIVMAPDWAESYNGQQGDPWDAQTDMLLALVGAGISALAICLRYGCRPDSCRTLPPRS
jgi:putative membrane protein